jgi:putative membrane-bound dehydrogenase-like protein
MPRFGLFLALAAFCVARHAPAADAAPLRAGAAVVDIAPEKFPVIVNGMFEERKADRALDPITARAIVIADGAQKIAIVVVDSCMVPRNLIDDAKEMAGKSTGIATDHMLVSATHSHSAPSSMGCLGSRADAAYQQFLPAKIAQAIEKANENLAPAKIGWSVVQDSEHTANRRWIYRPDKMLTDPFGVKSVRANMHPGYMNPNAMGPSGPIDPDLSMLAIQTKDGKPLALLCNYSMHYFGSGLLSADYYGRFNAQMAKLLDPQPGEKPFVAIMSQGTSGDQYWADYSKPARKFTLDQFAGEIADKVHEAYKKIEFHDSAPLVMKETKVTLGFRLCDEARLQWAKKTVEAMGDRIPKTQAEIYAREQLYLHERPKAELKLQALCIGELGITALPNEVYALTGLKLKAMSPLQPTFNIELANGAEGYIPPPEQHKLGGYTTWAARTAGLEVQAEPKILEAVVKLLEDVSEKPRRLPAEVHGSYAEAILAAKPAAYWRGGEMSGPTALDSSGNNNSGTYEDGVVFFLQGPDTPKFSSEKTTNRCPHFAGGRMSAAVKGLGNTYSVEFWFWNALQHDARAVTAYLFSRGADKAEGAPGDHLGIGGTALNPGKILFFNGNASNTVIAGTTELQTRTWHHVVLVRDGKKVTAYLNGNQTPEFSGEADVTVPAGIEQIFMGGRNDNFATLEGKLDEIAIYNRALTADEAAKHFAASGMPKVAAVETPAAPAPAAAKNIPPALSPQDSIKAIHVRQGFEIELVVSEPLVKDPVAIDWGADGKLWVAEMADYPLGMDGKMKPGGRIRVLEDTDGDGKYDKSTVFLDDVRMPTGIVAWRKGVIVAAAPDIFYAEDADGDGKAEIKKVLYTGFKEGNPQLRVNSLRWGLDNWLYCANGWSGGVIKSTTTEDKIDISGRDCRIRPDDGRIEAISGVSQFGRNRNDWGDWFGVNNSFPLWHYVLEDRYTKRNPHIAPPDPISQLCLPRNPKIFPARAPEKRFHSFNESGRFTSACSAIIYQDDLLFPASAEMNAFTCEPFHNLVHHEIVNEKGVTFSARADQEKDSEFIASEDRWFRPVMVRTGPDGCLWVVDMCRYMIEHPEWLPPEGKAELMPMYRAGDDLGRIYRVKPIGKTVRAVPRLDKLSPEQLAAAMDTSNGWQRDQIQKMLVWNGNDAAAIKKLEALVAESKLPQVRAQALCALDGMNARTLPAIRSALADAHSGVRRQAVRLTEKKGSEPAHADALKLVADPDAKVRLQLAASLGEWSEPEVGKVLGKLAAGDCGDRYIVAAAMSSATKCFPEFAAEILAADDKAIAALSDSLLTMALAMNQRDVAARLVDRTLSASGARQMEGFGQLLSALARRNTSLEKLTSGADDALTGALKKAAAVFPAARSLVADAAQPTEQRVAALNLLGREEANRASDLQLLAGLLNPQSPPEIQRAAIKSLGQTADAGVPELLFKGWAGHAPAARTAAIDELLGRDPWALELSQQIEKGKVSPLDLDAQRRERLLKHKSPEIKALAQKIFAASSNPDRQKVIDAYSPALKLKGDAKNGAAAFAKNCSTCHKVDGVGHEIGPNLRSVADHSPEKLLVSILDPSRAIEPGFTAFLCTLTSGAQLYGLITAETGSSISMKFPDDTTRTILRSEIKQLRSTKTSLMPEGLEATVTPQDMADIIQFLQAPPAETK